MTPTRFIITTPELMPLSVKSLPVCQTRTLTSLLLQMPLSALSRPPEDWSILQTHASMMIASGSCARIMSSDTLSYLDCTVIPYPSRDFVTVTHLEPSYQSFVLRTPDWWSKDYRLFKIYQASRWKVVPQLLLDAGCEPSAPPQYTPNSAKYYFPHITLTIFPNLDRILIGSTTYLLTIGTLPDILERILPYD